MCTRRLRPSWIQPPGEPSCRPRWGLRRGRRRRTSPEASRIRSRSSRRPAFAASMSAFACSRSSSFSSSSCSCSFNAARPRPPPPPRRSAAASTEPPAASAPCRRRRRRAEPPPRRRRRRRTRRRWVCRSRRWNPPWFRGRPSPIPSGGGGRAPLSSHGTSWISSSAFSAIDLARSFCRSFLSLRFDAPLAFASFDASSSSSEAMLVRACRSSACDWNTRARAARAAAGSGAVVSVGRGSCWGRSKSHPAGSALPPVPTGRR